MKFLKYTLFGLFGLLFLFLLCFSVSALTETTYYYDDYDTGTVWLANPQNMVDGNNATFAVTNIDKDVQILNGTNLPNGYTDSVSYVHARVYGKKLNSNSGEIRLRPKFKDGTDGDWHAFAVPQHPTVSWSSWFDITNDTNAPTWDWSEVENLNMSVLGAVSSNTIYCARVEILVGWGVNTPPYIGFSIPTNWTQCWNGSGGVPRSEIGIGISDDQNDNLDISVDVINMATTEREANDSWFNASSDASYVVNISSISDCAIFKIIVNMTEVWPNSDYSCQHIFYFGMAWVESDCSDCPSTCPSYSQTTYFNYSDANISYFNISILNEYDNETCQHWANATQNGYNISVTPVSSCNNSIEHIYYNRTLIEGSYLNLSFDISTYTGLFNYTIECNGTTKTENGVNNGTFYILLENISSYWNYTVYVNVTEGSNMVFTEFNLVLLSTDLTLTIDSLQLGIFISLILFFFFFYIGFTSEKASGGMYMMFAGFIFLTSEYLIATYLNSIIVVPLISPVAFYIIAMGGYKQFFKKKEKGNKKELLENV